MTISVITPTCDRPIGFAMAERQMQRQTVQPFEWIVVDGGEVPVLCTRGQRHLLNPSPPGVENFLSNLLVGVRAAAGELIAWWEDDDHYAPTHLEQLRAQLIGRPHALAAGDDDQRYYHVGLRQWRAWKNVGACLCQTMMRREAIAHFERVVQTCRDRERKSYGVDTNFWRGVPLHRRALANAHTVVGIKGIPGRHGLGVGHRPDEKWTADPDLKQLRAWIGGDDADRYAEFGVAHAAAR